MKQTLLNIADRLDARVKVFDTFPRTQATDAMKGIGGDIAAIIRLEAESMGDTPGLTSDDIKAIVNEQLTELTAPTKKAGKK